MARNRTVPEESRTQSTQRSLHLVDCVQEVLLCGDLPPGPGQESEATHSSFNLNPYLMANMPASVQTLLSSAPVELGQSLASSS